jgi:hypothetical protein
MQMYRSFWWKDSSCGGLMYCDPIFVCTSCFLQIQVCFICLNWRYLKGLKFISWCFRLNHLNSMFSSKLGRNSSLMVLWFALCFSFLSPYTTTLKLKNHYLFSIFPLKYPFTSHWFLLFSTGWLHSPKLLYFLAKKTRKNFLKHLNLPVNPNLLSIRD